MTVIPRGAVRRSGVARREGTRDHLRVITVPAQPWRRRATLRVAPETRPSLVQ